MLKKDILMENIGELRVQLAQDLHFTRQEAHGSQKRLLSTASLIPAIRFHSEESIKIRDG